MASFANDTASSSDSSHVRYYFTYGSNMHLQQMAQRCEESILYSKGRLEGYKWQVNSRGGANIVEGDGADFVEGLIFTVSSRDLDSLRRHEKISEGYFVEKEIDINIEKLSILHFEKQKTTRIADEMAYYQARIKTGGPLGSWNAILKKEASTQKHTFKENVAHKVLVYIVPEYCEDGKIRTEYVVRMKFAIADAEVLGVSKYYIEKYLQPHLV